MAHQRSGRKRRLATLRSTPHLTGALLIMSAVLLPAFLTGCDEAPGHGWFALPDESDAARPLAELRAAAGEAIMVRVELPDGYIPAEFMQRATLRIGEHERTDELFAPEATSFSFTLPVRVIEDGRRTGEDSAAARLELVLGFCEPEAKNVCYVDMSEIPVSLTDTADLTDTDATGVQTVIYRPEDPR